MFEAKKMNEPVTVMTSALIIFVFKFFILIYPHILFLIVETASLTAFSFIEVLQPCPSFFNTFQFYNEKVYEADANEKLIKEWNYDEKGRIPLGIFYKEERPTYEDEV